MSTYTSLNRLPRHAGAQRLENAVETVIQARRGLDMGKGLAAMLLSAIVSALLVVAEQLIDTWSEGHLLAAWVVLWIVGFSALALLAGAARHWAQRTLSALDAWSRLRARQRADRRLLDLAQRDPRVMADLQAAMNRDDA